jgi:hypothetical protein
MLTPIVTLRYCDTTDTMPPSPEPAVANGDMSASESPEAAVDMDMSDSDLSDPNDAADHPSYAEHADPLSDDEQDAPADSSVAEDLSGDDGSSDADADYDMEESPLPTNGAHAHDERAMSSESADAPRGSGDIDEKDYMKENPELYGLRRSVCGNSSFRSGTLLICSLVSRRPTATTRKLAASLIPLLSPPPTVTDQM